MSLEEHIKSWGKEIWISNSSLYCGKKLILSKGKDSSLHFHKIKDETFYIQKGKVRMEIHPNGKKQIIIMKRGDSLHIYPGLLHQFFGIENSEIFEFSTQHFEEDTYRIKK
jgi:mannose-6-phosphate isomerase-like protein (cupin superfamily)